MCSDGLCREFAGVYVMDKMGLLRCGLKETDGGAGVAFNPSALRLQLQHLFRKCLSKYHDGWLVCGDDTCAHRTRNVLCDVHRDGEQAAWGVKCPAQGCPGKMRVEYTSEQLYLQTLYMKQLFDVSHSERKLAEENVSRTQRGLLSLKAPVLEDADKTAIQVLHSDCHSLLQQSAYNQIDLASLFSFTAPAETEDMMEMEEEDM